ncbi:MAG TPA: C1 family peptidase [Panacibacter sp.]|nr:C1 family peptidase [Panacibacter sp.]HNP42925.1 C1 family peptidase [Panacibacter sp.]
MPIRMVDDPNDSFDNSNQGRSGGGGGRFPGGGGGGSLIALLFGLIRNPVGLVLVLIVAGFLYFKDGCSGMMQNISSFATGGVLDPREFDKAPVYEGLDETKNTLPEAVSLLKFAPAPGDQGQQGSCVAWSSAYGARTILEASSAGFNPNQTAFSPSFMYNQIGLDGCQGSYIIRAMENLTKVGAVPLDEFPYNDQDCSRQPSSQVMRDASQYRMLGFTRLTRGDNVDNISLYAIKEHLSKDVPVVIGMMVGGSFMQGMMGQEIWHPQDQDYSMMGFGGHAMCVIGYDDRKEGGAFQILNSWGSQWGQNGVAWVRYSDFKQFVREAYGLNPMPKRGSAAAQNLECSIGLVDNKTKQYIPLKLRAGNTFQTTGPIIKGTQFKMEVKNSAACYVYVLGLETDGSSYVLFPYPTKADPTKTKFSPYCGITGYRLFPRGMSMMADSIGNKDWMAVVVSKDSMNVFRLNDAVNSSRSLGFAQAVNAAIREQAISGVSFTGAADGSMGFKTQARDGDKAAVACIVEIDKQ